MRDKSEDNQSNETNTKINFPKIVEKRPPYLIEFIIGGVVTYLLGIASILTEERFAHHSPPTAIRNQFFDTGYPCNGIVPAMVQLHGKKEIISATMIQKHPDFVAWLATH